MTARLLYTVSKFDDRVERRALGRSRRNVLRRVDQCEWKAWRGRDVVALLRAAEAGRKPELLPIKYGRMAASPFAFFRGAAPVMAADLARLPRTGIEVQICGDAHVRNLGAFGAPDGHVVFDINDFDETTRATWEWDIKRLATSFVVAGREAGDSDRLCREAVEALVMSYRESLEAFERMPAIDLARHEIRRHTGEGPVHDVLGKAERATPLVSLRKLTVRRRRGLPRFAHRPPLLTRVPPKEAAKVIRSLTEYRRTLGPARQLVLDAYCPVDVAFKVVGTGSVGALDYVVLCFGNGPKDPLLLQVKQAFSTCYARFAKVAGGPRHQGMRVAEGQHRMQTVADPFLGWTTIDANDFLVRQLADHKASIEPDDLRGAALIEYALVCGEIFAKAHARTGDSAVLFGYCGSADKLDRAMGKFAVAYADQVTRDWESLNKAIKAKAIRARRVD
jgi:uncharacterized protein (DUF2252 family)